MSKETTPTQKGPSDTHIYIYTGDGGEYRVHPSPAVVHKGNGKVVFRNLCDTGVKLKLKKVRLEPGTLKIPPGGTESVTLSADAKLGAHTYTAEALMLTKPRPAASGKKARPRAHAMAVKGNSSPKIIVDT